MSQFTSSLRRVASPLKGAARVLKTHMIEECQAAGASLRDVPRNAARLQEGLCLGLEPLTEAFCGIALRSVLAPDPSAPRQAIDLLEDIRVVYKHKST